jgi:hypothetical protein
MTEDTVLFPVWKELVKVASEWEVNGKELI